jgi:hypothetical protein
LIWGGFSEGAKHVPTRVIHQYIDWTQFSLGLSHGLVDRNAICDVAFKCCRAATRSLDLIRNLLSRLQIHVEYCDLGPLRSEATAGGAADAARTTGHDHGFVLKSLHAALHFSPGC